MIRRLQDWFRHQIELQAFGACHYLGEKMGISPITVRMYFIYISFLTFGSPILIYFIIAFWLNIRTYLRRGRDLMKG